MSYREPEYVLYEVQQRVAFIRLNRPERLNAIANDLADDLARVFALFVSDNAADVAIISGVGRAFCAGRDLKEEADPNGRPFVFDPNRQLTRYHVSDTAKPLIAAVHGFAIGGGFGIVLGCDYRIASEDATFSYPEVALGMPGPSDLPLQQVVGRAIATEISLLGRRVQARRLYEVGLINEVVPRADLECRALEVANEFIRLPQAAIRATKELMMLERPTSNPAVAIRRGELVGGSSERGGWDATSL